MHQHSDNSKSYVQFCQYSFGQPLSHSWHQFHYSYQHGDHIATAAFTTISDGDSLLNCPHCDRTFTSRIGLVSNLRIHRTETGETVPGAPTSSRDGRLHCPTILAHSLIASAYSVTCASMTTCGKPPESKLHQHALPTPILRQHPQNNHVPINMTVS
ncbi:unnamed protein product [Schistocephalus solidus]|uniref:C2H2-type domain-containing protein n=1 Tax=Schistocephalus solidus TaxID=70667 RepID=A0A183SNA8_SCHSO|nr:unnamed protein product [Schistocephalus solidus]